MNIEEYRDYCLSKKGVTEETPFGKLSSVLVFKVMGKMFTATDMDTFESISIKCHPGEVEEMRASYDSVQVPAYLSKKHWNKVLMDYTISDQLLCQWLDTSYDLVVQGLTKKLKEELAAL